MARLPENYGAQSVADGGTIAHGLGRLPRTVHVTGSVSATIANVTAVTATTFTVSLRNGLAAAATQTVYWTAR